MDISLISLRKGAKCQIVLLKRAKANFVQIKRIEEEKHFELDYAEKNWPGMRDELGMQGGLKLKIGF